MIISHWIQKTVDEWFEGTKQESEAIRTALVEALQRACPFDPDIAYEPVGAGRDLLYLFRTKENCWCSQDPNSLIINQHSQLCQAVQAFMQGILQAREPPLLICTHCDNTESPAGAMARGWQHGLCAYCGGSFKVVRA